METLQRMPFRAQKAVFEKLEEVMTLASLSKDEREQYDESVKVLRDRLSELAYAQDEGLKQGRAEGKEQERLKNARGMKAAGLSYDLIAQITGLAPDVIEKL